MKRIVSLVLAMSMVLSMFASVFASTRFEDVATTKYAGAVEALANLIVDAGEDGEENTADDVAVISGMPDGTFQADRKVTRAEFAKMLVLAAGLYNEVEELKEVELFSDVPAGKWYVAYVNAATKAGLITGYPDGSFKPEKEVTYAEAFAMAVRALGWGKVAEETGVWPIGYTTVASRLELDEGFEYEAKASEPAIRGNIALMLWNMLRAPMWTISSENQETGMNSSADPDTIMLNLTFRDYYYAEDVYLTDVNVTDDGEVTATVENDKVFVNAYLENVDLPRLVIGMKVSALVRNYDEEDATFVTLTPAYSFVEGLVEEVKANKITIGDKTYRMDDTSDFAKNDYVIAEVNGNKVTTTEVTSGDELVEVPVMKTLVTSATEVAKIRNVENKIPEEALVILDGKWTTRADIEVGDVYTEIAEYGDSYWMVTREREEGTFESYSVEKGAEEIVYLEIDGEEYRALASNFKAYEEEDNKTEVAPADLRKKADENKYLNQDVELVLNYLGQVVKMNFGEVSELAAKGNFYAVVSNGTWDDTTEDGLEYYIKMVGQDGEAAKYVVKKKSDADQLPYGSIYSGDSGEAVFVWAKFDAEDDTLIKSLEIVAAGEYGDYVVQEFSEELNDDNYLNNASGSKVDSSTVVYTVTPILVEEDGVEEIDGFEVEISEGVAALDGVTEGLVAFDKEDSLRARYVFVTDDPKSEDLYFGKVEKDIVEIKGENYVTIDGVTYKIDEDADETAFVSGDFVAFTINNDLVECKEAYKTTYVAGAAVVEKVEATEDANGNAGRILYFSGDVDDATIAAMLKDNKLDLTTKEVKDLLADYTFVTAELSTETANAGKAKLVFLSGVEVVEELASVEIVKGDRLVIDTAREIVVVLTGLEANDVVDAEGYVVVAE